MAFHGAHLGQGYILGQLFITKYEIWRKGMATKSQIIQAVREINPAAADYLLMIWDEIQETLENNMDQSPRPVSRCVYDGFSWANHNNSLYRWERIREELLRREIEDEQNAEEYTEDDDFSDRGD
jgi:hypothetical protein